MLVHDFPNQEEVITEYILYACPNGELTQDLSKFWEECQNEEKLKNEAVTVYPPHVSLTGFFKQELSESEYIFHLRTALKEVQEPKNSKFEEWNIQIKPTLHAGYFKNDYLKKVTELFARKAAIPKERLKAGEGHTMYHLTLANKFNPEIKEDLLKLEEKIDFKKPYGMSICLYKSTCSGNERFLVRVFEDKI